MNQKEFITNLLKKNPNAVIVGSLGTITYDLKDIPHNSKILVKGAMGSAVGVGLGFALNTKKDVIIIIGDGAFLMKMGYISTVLRYAPKNLKIYIMNNGHFKSCGCQETNFDYVEDLIPYPFEIVDVIEK